MNRLTINISGFEYIGDLYSIEDNVNIKKDFIMIRSLSLIEDSLYNNEIYIIDKDIYKSEYEKAKRQLEKKYSGYELDRKIKERLYRKGFNVLEHMGDNYED